MHTLEQLRSGQLAGSTRLDLACGLRDFPTEIFNLADTLEVLNLSRNALSALPPDLHRLHKLRVLFCSDNRFTQLPESIGACQRLSMVGFKANQISHVPAAALPPQLRWLILTDNRIEALPPELGRCRALQKLMLAGNRLSALPDTLAQCERLELLRISANQLPALPGWLLHMPRLSWLAYAGNPFVTEAEAQALLHAQGSVVAWADLAVQGVLGEGASGVIHAGRWQRVAEARDEAQDVAIKLFKGDMTSDGLPRSEMAASLAAGTHAQLIGVHGLLQGHPEGREGLVMQRTDARCQALAGPPSLASCTRDVYPEGLHLSLPTALQLALDVAAAACHLHACGILHGDLYAHNTLWRAPGHALLGDLGAASLLPLAGTPGDTAAAHSALLTRLEVRAMGCLLEELASLTRLPDTAPADIATLAALQTLAEQCMQPEVATRPAMPAVHRALQALRDAAEQTTPV
jgi:hypothetical protein